jgi:hypothetical protein
MAEITDEERGRRIRARVAEERETAPLSWVYLSFADGTRPEGTQFLGAVIVRAHGTGDAISQAWKRGINPGGEVKSAIAPPEFEPPEAFRDRLLSRDDIAEMDRQMGFAP